MPDDVTAGYETNAKSLIPRYDGVDPLVLYGPVMEYFPAPPACVLDIGAGTGRDAKWLNNKGYKVTAVEPVQAFREAGKHSEQGQNIRWHDSRLPDLAGLSNCAHCFDMILLNAVWHHLDPSLSAKALETIAALTARNGTIVLSIRHGECAPQRPGFVVDVDDLMACGCRAGLESMVVKPAKSVQEHNVASGVTWRWVVFRQP